jgi:hypothetical protein
MRLSRRRRWRPSLLAAALALAALAPAAGAAAGAPDPGEEACAEDAAAQPRAAFDVAIGTYPTVVVRGLDIAGVNRVRSGPAPTAFLAHGLCVADYRLTYRTRSEGVDGRPHGRVCAWIGSVVVNLTPEDIRVYIPKEYPPDSCESRELLAHEMEHERLYRSELYRLADKIRDGLARSKELPRPLDPAAATPAEAYAQLKRLVDAVVRPIYKDYLKEIEKKQEGLDDPKSYRELGAKCSGWKRG